MGANPKINFEGLEFFGAAIWIPTFLLWTISMIKYFIVYYLGTISIWEYISTDMNGFGIGMLLLLAMFPLIIFFVAGFYLPQMAKTFDEFLNPPL